MPKNIAVPVLNTLRGTKILNPKSPLPRGFNPREQRVQLAVVNLKNLSSQVALSKLSIKIPNVATEYCKVVLKSAFIRLDYSDCIISGSESDCGVKAGTMCKNNACTTVSCLCLIHNV